MSRKKNFKMSIKAIIALGAALVVLIIATLIYQIQKPFLPQRIQTAVAFSDISPDQLKKDYVLNASLNYMQAKQILSGYEDGSFKPENPINRAEFTKILVTSLADASKIPDEKEQCFTDVKGSEWFAKYVCYAKSKNWIKGYADGSFQPSNTINQAEIDQIIAEALDWNNDQNENVSLPSNVDKKAWYADAIKSLYAKNILLEPGKINPSQLMTRKDVSTLLFKATLVDTLKVQQFDQAKVPDLFKVQNIAFTGEPKPITPEPAPKK